MKFFVLSALLLASASVSSRSLTLESFRPLSLKTLDKAFVKDDRIVGGVVATPNEFPWQISLQRRGLLGGWSHSCGGSIYNSQYIIDASHCVDGTQVADLRVVAGEHSLTTVSGYEQAIPVQSYIMHPDYDPRTNANDIALLKLKTPLDFSNGKVGPINLPAQGQSIEAGTTCIVSGWGTLSSGGVTSDALRKVAVPIISESDCKSLYGSTLIKPSMICAGFVAGGADSCQGDSGGPLFTINPPKLIGVVSWGNGCADAGYPGVYARVANFVSWIKEIAG